jgi:ribose transport system substrate-binding protein
MRVLTAWKLLVVLSIGLLVAAGCAPPGSNSGGGGDSGNGDGGGGGTAAEQVVRESTGTEAGGEAGGSEVCNVEPPDVNLENATVGFSQSESETNPFRITETASIESAAEERGIDLISTNAQTEASKQLSDIQNMLSQGVDVLIVAPLNAQGLEPVFQQASEQNVPVFLIDRETAGTPCEDFITFMGSDFIGQGERAAQKLDEITEEDAKIAELRGTPGASVTNDRGEGFRNVAGNQDDMEIIASQTGNFVRADGQQVMEQLIQSNPDLNAVYAHNDEMALGAIQALEGAGKTPGEDVKIVSVDGTEGATQAIVNGNMNATVETNPRFGPLAFDTIQQFLDGESIPQNIIVQDRVIDSSNAEEYLQDGAY